MKNNKTIFYNSKDIKQEYILTNYRKKIAYNTEYRLNSKQEFIGVKKGDEEINSNLIGNYNYTNIIASITIGEYFNIDNTEIKNGIENYFPDNNRSQLIERDGYDIIMDAYNSNPSSMEVAIENFKTLKGKKCIIIGEMLELGDISKEEHKILVNKCEESRFEKIPYARALAVETVWLFQRKGSSIFGRVYYRCVFDCTVLSVPKWIQSYCNAHTREELIAVWK